MATPAFRFLRRRFPDADIDCLGPPPLAGMESFFPWLDEILPFRCPWSPRHRDYSLGSMTRTWSQIRDLRDRKYSWAFDLRGDLRDIHFLFLTGASNRVGFGTTGAGALLTHLVPFEKYSYRHQVEGNLVVASFPFDAQPSLEEFHPEIRIPPEWVVKAREWLTERGIKAFVAVHPGASLVHKRWPSSSWAELLDEVILPSCPVVLFGASTEMALLDEIENQVKQRATLHRANVDLPMFLSLLSLARGVVCLDSVAAHAAAATKVPVVALLGPSPAWFSQPYSPRARAVYLDDVPCRPCLRRCTQPRNFCMLDLSVPMVVPALVEAGIL